MKKFLLAVFALLLPVAAVAGEFKDKDSIFTINMPAGWSKGESDNPAVSLRVENGSSSFEFEKQEDVLSDYYLKSGVGESVEAVKARGANFYGAEINSVSIYGVTNAYYTAYEASGVNECAAFFTYNNHSFSMSAVGVGPELCRNIIATVCKPGTKCVPPCSPYNCMAPNYCKAGKCVAPPPCAPDNCAAPKICKNNRCVNPPCSPENCAAPKSCVAGRCVLATAAKDKKKAASDKFESSAGTGDESEDGQEEGTGTSEDSVENAVENAAAATEQAVSSVIDSISNASKAKTALPEKIRKPVPIFVWAVIFGLWFIGAAMARGTANLHKNPKLPPPPKEVPPDFFFPFVISTMRASTFVQYNVQTRQKQKLYGRYEYKYVPYLVWPVTALIVFHIVWSVIGFAGQNDLFISKIFALPFGSFLSMFPELPFVVLIFIGLIMYFRRSKTIDIYDSRQTLMMSAAKETKDYCIIRDGKGKEVARLIKKSSSPRTWEFIDADNNPMFILKDDAPAIYSARKLFGYQGGALRSRYGIFDNNEKRAGYTFMDPMSADRFQVHMDFAFARIAHPAQMLAAILFVISYEKDSWYPTIF